MTPTAAARRIGAGARKPENWVALLKFGVVGGSGYVINLLVFAAAVKLLGLHHVAAAIVAFLVAVTNNFHWNRKWTFSSEARIGPQAVRFLTVSTGGLVINIALLVALVGTGMNEVLAQAIAVACAVPFNFVANKLWTFE